MCQLSIYNSFPVIRTTTEKNRRFYVPPSSFFCLPWGRPCGNHAKRCMNEKTIQCLPNPLQHVPIYLQQFPSYSNCKCKKIAVFTYRSPHFCFPWRRPCVNHAKRCMSEKTIQSCQTPRSMYPSIFNTLKVIRTASAKNRRFHVPQPTFLFPLETPLRLSRNMLHRWKYNSMPLHQQNPQSVICYWQYFAKKKQMKCSENVKNV